MESDVGRVQSVNPIGIGEASAQSDPDREVEQEAQVGLQALGRETLHRPKILPVEAASGALVGERRIDEAIADDDRTRLDRGSQDAADMFGTVGRVEQGFGFWEDSTARRVQNQTPDFLAERGPPRLARDDDAVTRGPQPSREVPSLGRFPRPLRSLEGNQQTEHHGYRMPSR